MSLSPNQEIFAAWLAVLQVIVLKARHLGLAWLVFCYALWMMLFRQGFGILLFSRREDEAAELLDEHTWEQVAVLYGAFEPQTFAGYLAQVAAHYNQALTLVERDNHGHTVLLALEYTTYQDIHISPLDQVAGCLSTRRGKVLAVENAAQALRGGCCTLYHQATLAELADLEAVARKAPGGSHDDLAMAFINGLAGLRWGTFETKRSEGVSTVIERPAILADLSFLRTNISMSIFPLPTLVNTPQKSTKSTLRFTLG